MYKRSLILSGWTVPAFLLLLTVLSFGLLLPNLGFYWDDWAKILAGRLWGMQSYLAYYAEDRPLSAWTHMLFTPLLGYSPLPWQVFTLLLRWLSAWAMWWALNGLWPRARCQNLVAALLFLVYPAFAQQPAGVTFHQQWLQFALFFLSLGVMISAQSQTSRRKFWLLNGLSLAAMLLQLTVTEYFAPLELIRPLILWFLIANLSPAALTFRARAGKVLRAGLPYLTLITVYVLWRLFFLRLPGDDPYRANTLYDFLASPLATLHTLLVFMRQDLIGILYELWIKLLDIQVYRTAALRAFSYAVGLGAAALVIFFLFFYRKGAADDAPGSEHTWLVQALVVGVAALLLGPIPAWITGRQIVFDFHSDRYALPALFGAGLLFAVGITWLAQRRLQRAILTGLLVMLAVGLHVRTAGDYRAMWANEQRFFWQLSWRAPALKAPTALYLLNEPFPNQGLFSTSAALNLMYPQPAGYGAPTNQPGNNLAYWFYTIRPRYKQAPNSFKISLKTTFRTLRFIGQTPNSLLIHNDPAHGNCLWVLSERDAKHPYLAYARARFPAHLQPEAD